MNTEDLKLLGFHLLEEDEVIPEQRESKVQVTYSSKELEKADGKASSLRNSDGAGSSIVRSVALSPDGDDYEQEDEDRPAK